MRTRPSGDRRTANKTAKVRPHLGTSNDNSSSERYQIVSTKKVRGSYKSQSNARTIRSAVSDLDSDDLDLDDLDGLDDLVAALVPESGASAAAVFIFFRSAAVLRAQLFADQYSDSPTANEADGRAWNCLS